MRTRSSTWVVAVGALMALCSCDGEGDDGPPRLRFFASNRGLSIGERVTVTLEQTGLSTPRWVALSVNGAGRFVYADATDASAGLPGFDGSLPYSGGPVQIASGQRSWTLEATAAGNIVVHARVIEDGGVCGSSETPRSPFECEALPLVLTVYDRLFMPNPPSPMIDAGSVADANMMSDVGDVEDAGGVKPFRDANLPEDSSDSDFDAGDGSEKNDDAGTDASAGDHDASTGGEA